MALLDVVLQVVSVVALLHLVGLAVLVGPRRVRAGSRNVRSNLEAVSPVLVVLVVLLVTLGVIRDIGVELSWLIGLNVTGYIHAIEGQFVADLQTVATPTLTAYFGFVYVFGYVFLLTFPAVAYVLQDDPRPLSVTLVAYVINYGVGLLCYVLFVAYGPRNFMPELVEPLLYTSWPQSQLLTGQVNVNTNVFPSLHTSLSATVALIAYRFRARHPTWTLVAAVLAASIAVATMYLGIHWLIDVVAGVVLAVASVETATRTDVETYREWVERIDLDAGIRNLFKGR